MSDILYQDLDVGNQEIRLLSVASAASLREPLVCELMVVSLFDRPRYEAISYAWGDATQRASLTLNGVIHHASQSLVDALSQFRQQNAPIALWADQLCINQNDVIEKSHQIRLMATIYQQARRVKVWLGKAGPRNAELMRFLAGETFASINGATPFQEARNASFYALLTILLSRPWWTRVWVLQEVILAREAQIYSGVDHILLRDLIATTDHLSESEINGVSSPSTSSPEHIQFLRMLQKRVETFASLKSLQEQATNLDLYRATQATHQATQPSQATQPLLFEDESSDEEWVYSNLLEILIRGRGQFATDPRDKVYSLLGLLPESVVSAVNPDYSISAGSVFAHVSRLILLSTGSLDILYHAIGHDIGGNTPSWAATFSTYRSPTEEAQYRLKAQLLEIFDASGGTKAHITSPTNDLLVLRGFRVGTVTFIAQGIRPGRAISIDGLLTILNEWSIQTFTALLSLGGTTNDTNYSDDMEQSLFKETFLSAIISGTLPVEGTNLVRSYEGSDIATLWNRIFDTDDSLSLQNDELREDSLSNHIIKCIYGKSIFVTQNGSMGLGPTQVQKGDQIYILAGGRLPFVLRQSPTDSQNFVLIGDAYVHGVMHDHRKYRGSVRRDSLSNTQMQRDPKVDDLSLDFDNWRDIYLNG